MLEPKQVPIRLNGRIRQMQSKQRNMQKNRRENCVLCAIFITNCIVGSRMCTKRWTIQHETMLENKIWWQYIYKKRNTIHFVELPYPIWCLLSFSFICLILVNVSFVYSYDDDDTSAYFFMLPFLQSTLFISFTFFFSLALFAFTAILYYIL